MSTTNNFNFDTDDYDIYNSQGNPEPTPGTPELDENLHFVTPSQPYFSPSTLEVDSLITQNPNNTGPTTDFWTFYPLSIDVNGYIFYYDENTGINIRGPEGAPQYISFTDLTEEQKEELKGADGLDGTNGVNGADGVDGVDGLDAYHVWLQDQGYSETDHPISEFYEYIARYSTLYVKEGTGEGSLIVNYRGLNNTADGDGSFAAGNNTSAEGTNSFTAGKGTVAASSYQAAFGLYNDNDSNNVFEIGIGNSSSIRKNAFEVNWYGDITASRYVIDGYGNILSNKVDKVVGKQLSTNDFSDTYKNFIDNYTIDTTLSPTSMNPIVNSSIYWALEDLKNELDATPKIEERTDNQAFSMLSYESNNSSTEELSIGIKFNELTYNPFYHSGSFGQNNALPSFYNTFSIGSGLELGANNQIVLGQYNLSNNTDVFQIGGGTGGTARLNLLSVDSEGNLTSNGDIIDGDGNILSGKQDILQFDSTPTLNSSNVMTSGAIYNTLISCGITPGQQITIPDIAIIQARIDALAAQVNNIITNQIIDDVTVIPYKIGVVNGQFYIQSQQAETEEEGE